MRIGIDVRLWNQSGVGRYIRNLVENLLIIDKKNSYVLFALREDLKDIPKNYNLVLTDARWHSLKEQTKFSKILEREKLDLVHFPYFSHPIFYNKPFVITIHDLITGKFSTGNASTLPLPFYTIKKFGYNLVLNHGVKISKKIIVPTNFVKDELIKELKGYKDKILVTHEGVDDRIRNVESKNVYGKYFLYVGNAFPHKNLKKLIEAFKIFNKNRKDFKLLLVGKKDYFYEKIQETEKNNSILFLHDVSDINLSSLYKNAVSFVSCSLMEGFGLPALEALSNNCPLLLSDIPVFKEVCGNLPLYFNPKNENEIADKMNIIVKESEGFYNQKQKEVKNILDNFTWKKTAEETLTIYESCFSLR